MTSKQFQGSSITGDRVHPRRHYSPAIHHQNKPPAEIPISIAYHPAIEVERFTGTVKFEAEFHENSLICMVGANGALPHQVDTTALSILTAYADSASNLEIHINFRNSRDESAGLRQSIRNFMKRLADCIKTFESVRCPFIAVKVEAEDIAGAYDQLRGLASFYFLKTDWELWVCFGGKKGDEETYVKQYIGDELDRRIQGRFNYLAQVQRIRNKKKNMRAMAGR